MERFIIFTVFFQYGLLTEMLFMQIAIIILQLTTKSPLPASYRFLSNSLMFTIVSLGSAFMFYFAGGSFDNSLEPWKLVSAGLVYAISYATLNNIVIYLFIKFEKEETKDFFTVALWDFVTSLVLLPMAISYSLLTAKLGIQSVLLLGVPFLFMQIIFKMYFSSDSLNKKLSSAVEIGHELTDSLRSIEVLDIFTQKIQSVVNYDQAYLLDLRKGQKLVLLSSVEAGNLTRSPQFFNYEKGTLEKLPVTRTQVYGKSSELTSLDNFHFSSAVESVMVAPVKRQGNIEGYLVMTSFRKHFFEELDEKMVDLLTSYFEAAVLKAFHYEQTIERSEKCGLTNLYNFRYLTKKLSHELSLFHEQEISSLSAIILDIDHFKSINDSYGHQSGNDILCTFAQILKKYETDGRTLARYGGEEFVLLLPDFTKDEAVSLAERIRKEVERYTFEIKPDLSNDNESIGINLTVSLGVSSIPEDTQSDSSLLRNADRALYIGGKQAGRNRVGVYEGELTQPLKI
ncbi:GGDEF domain-containing protein [Sporosarcina jeotgali]|uniref:GGDEF domain-containing protein n=1 Tax=Sporosarcina jeotgali TaxID=3020056 RepID=A0ABZ0KSN7_9BACL|nr:GGDEF domain-containing protein [Sporosarcina sp. B2O-1]WOV82949.1 GGDEF domain-containing protein [Sporosarcina sp. B2O-1]